MLSYWHFWLLISFPQWSNVFASLATNLYPSMTVKVPGWRYCGWFGYKIWFRHLLTEGVVRYLELVIWWWYYIIYRTFICVTKFAKEMHCKKYFTDFVRVLIIVDAIDETNVENIFVHRNRKFFSPCMYLVSEHSTFQTQKWPQPKLFTAFDTLVFHDLSHPTSVAWSNLLGVLVLKTLQ